MRPNRTPPLALLAALTTLPLAGCVGEGELEPDWGAAVEALVEEVEGGIWADGSPLAYEGDGNPNIFFCLDFHDCRGRCEQRLELLEAQGQNAGGCVCILFDSTGDGNQDGVVCKAYARGGGGDGGEVEVPEVDNSEEEEGEDPHDPGGRGGGNGKDRDPVLDVELVCDKNVVRGSTGGCRVEEAPDSAEYMWWLLGSSDVRRDLGSSWSGIATEDRRIMVSVSSSRTASMLLGEVTVRPRWWKLEEQSADTVYVPFSDDRQWGAYEGGAPSPEKLEGTEQGTGPWEGTWILADRQPTITAATGYVSWDLESGEPLARYKLVHETCGLPRGDSIGVYDLNAVDHEDCSNKAAIDDWKATVVAHEFEHENSLNECIDSVNDDGRLAEVEAIVSTKSEADAKDQAEKLWTKGLREKLLKAKRTAQEGEESPVIWEWRRDRQWKKHTVEFTGHTGTDGCPK